MGVGEGSLVELSLKNGKTVITPNVAIDFSRFSNADDEYTPAQRKTIDADLAEGLADIKAGRVSKAFSNPSGLIADLHKAAKKLSARKMTPTTLFG